MNQFYIQLKIDENNQRLAAAQKYPFLNAPTIASFHSQISLSIVFGINIPEKTRSPPLTSNLYGRISKLYSMSVGCKNYVNSNSITIMPSCILYMLPKKKRSAFYAKYKSILFF